jgi:uncharacterized protein
MLNMLRLNYILFSLVLCLMSACSKVGNSVSSKGQPLSTPYSLPAQAYLGLANRQAGEEKSALIIMAAGRAIFEGNAEQGQTWLEGLTNLPPLLDAQKHILLAKIQTLKNRPQEAIRFLSDVHDANQLPLFYQVQYHEILAFSYDATARFPEAIGERIILDKLLPSESDKIRNLRVMWLILTSLPDAELNTMLVEWPDSAELQGWLKLAQIAKMHGLSGGALFERLRAWQAQYPKHPAESMLPAAILNGQTHLYPIAKQVALLLPTTGPLSGPGQAVYDGFMAALNQSGAQGRVEVRLYNTALGNVAHLYEQAVSEGADFVVGPLSKPDVAQVASLAHPVPTLLLNDADKAADQNVYYLTLSPMSEARQVAMKARQESYRHALIIAPQGHWGDEVTQAFEQQWRARGGKVEEVLHYNANAPIAKTMRDFLHYTESLTAGAQPARRQDFDMIFLVAYPSKAREIMPLLRYYYLGRTPVYATSAVYAGSVDLKQDRDLEGLVFCDMPYVFTHDLPNKHWPEPLNSYSRLYSLGMDSYALTHQLNALLLFPALGVDDKSGVLYLNHNHQIVRILAWGKFRQGRAEVFSSAFQAPQ